jgi:hypothetical protein
MLGLAQLGYWMSTHVKVLVWKDVSGAMYNVMVASHIFRLHCLFLVRTFARLTASFQSQCIISYSVVFVPDI